MQSLEEMQRVVDDWTKNYRPETLENSDENAKLISDYVVKKYTFFTIGGLNEAIKVLHDQLAWTKQPYRGSASDKLALAGMSAFGGKNHAHAEESNKPSMLKEAADVARRLYDIGEARQAYQKAKSIIEYDRSGSRIDHSKTQQSRTLALEAFRIKYPNFEE